MSDHSGSVFNNSCVKLPRNPKSNNNQPLPVYEQKLLNELQNEVTKLKLDSPTENKDKDTVKSYIEFYDSIPEYDDVNHLSNREFYEKIEMLKEKQKSYFNHLHNGEWLDNERNFKKKSSSTIKPFCVTPILSSKSPKLVKNPEDVDSLSLLEPLKPPSRRSVRIETPISNPTPTDSFRRPKSRLPSASSNDFSTIDEYLQQSKSAPNSPSKSKLSVGWKDSITIPKPFEMTVRDEENKIVDELLASKPVKNDKPEMFKANPVPIESQIPLFDKIMADQERKNYIVRERSKALLESQMRPFSFTKRDEEIQKLTKGLSKSSPSLFLDDPPIKIKKFKAKPIPKNLFSNYIYKKMHEDEFYRALQKKIRSEELLRAASLPPSMAKREKYAQKYDVCPRSYRALLAKEENNSKEKKKLYDFNFEKELEELKNEFMGPTGKKSKRNRKNRNSASTSISSRTISSLDLRGINRSNLAAVLRIQSARKRLEMEMCRKLEEAKLKEEARWREKVMRKKPVWQSLAYSHEEDLAMRLQLRRDEEKLRSEEHKLRMQMMLGRVNQQPTLFERQSQLKYPKNKDELLRKLYGEYVAKSKDAAIQALVDEDLDDSISSCNNSKESSKEEEKEKCDSISS